MWAAVTFELQLEGDVLRVSAQQQKPAEVCLGIVLLHNRQGFSDHKIIDK